MIAPRIHGPLLALAVVGGVLLALGAGASRASAAGKGGWESIHAAPGASDRPCLVVFALDDRPQSGPSLEELERAWLALHPRAERLRLTSWDTRLGNPSALVAWVLDRDGNAVARRDGGFAEGGATPWLAEALELAADPEPEAADHDGRARAAEQLLRLGALERAESVFRGLAAEADWTARACERLARLSLQRGDLALTAEFLDRALDADTSRVPPGRLLLTQGLLDLARRACRGAAARLGQAVGILEARHDGESVEARLAWARALAAAGEESRALEELAPLLRPLAACDFERRVEAQSLAAFLHAPPVH